MGSEAMRALGERIYEESLGDRRGFRSDQTGVPDELWPEIYEGIGRAAMRHCEPVPEPYEIGIKGKAYDLPGERRVYTYQEQPDNVGACRLGYAATQARSASGDAVDVGLALLQSLEERGFGVFELAAPRPEPDHE